MTLWLDRLFIAGLLFLILATPFAFGAVHPWAYSAMEAVIFALVIVWMAKRALLAREQGVWRTEQGTQHPTPKTQNRCTPLALPLALFIALCLFQLVPLPPPLLKIISPQTYETYTQILPGWPERPPYAELASLEQSAPSVDSDGASIALTPNATNSERTNSTNAINSTNATNPRPDVGGQKSEVRELERANATFPNPTPNSENPTPASSHLAPSQASSWRPLSLAPFLSRTILLKFTAYAALFLLILSYPLGETWQLTAAPFVYTGLERTEAKFCRTLLYAILFTGLAVAAVGFLERFSWNGKVLWFFVPYDWGEPMANGVPRASGPFVNPDHFANYLAMIFPIAVGCALFRTAAAGKAAEQPLRIACAFTVLLVFAAILLSLSRGGWIGTLLSVAVLLWLAPWGGVGRSIGFSVLGFRHPTPRTQHPIPNTRNQHASRLTPLTLARIAVVVVCTLLITSLFLVGPQGRDQVDARLGETIMTDAGLSARAAILRDSRAMLKDFPLFGVGLGAWPELFLRYRSAPWTRQFFREAHNDYLQLGAETGVVGVALLAWFFFLGGRRLVGALKNAGAKNLPLLAGILAALAGMALHEWFDFNLQIPANALLFVTLFALGLRIAGSAGSVPGVESMAPWEVGEPRPEISAQWSEVNEDRGEGLGVRDTRSAAGGRWSPVTAALVSILAAVLLVCAVNQDEIPYPYNLKDPESVAQAKALALAYPTNAPYHFELLRLLGERMSGAARMSALKAALWIDPNNPYYRDDYAALLGKLGRTEASLKEITRSVALSPSLETHHYLRQELIPNLSPAEQNAVAAGFKHAMAQDDPQAMNYLARFYARLGRYADQAALYEQAARQESDGAKKANLLIAGGLAYLKAGRDQDDQRSEVGDRKSEVGGQKSEISERANSTNATNSTNAQRANSTVPNPTPNTQTPTPGPAAASSLFHQAVAAEPAGPKAYRQLILLSAAQQDLAGAKQIVALGIANGAPALPLYLALAQAAQQAGNAAERKAALSSAKTAVEKSIKRGEDAYALNWALADGARAAGDRDSETAAVAAALERQPRSAKVLARLAGLYLEKQNFDRAALYLNRIANIDPDSADVYYRIAQAEEGRYRFAAAAAAYARAVELAPKNENYRQRYEAFRERMDRERKVANSQSP